MDEQSLRRFIAQIVASKDRDKIRLSLNQLMQIIERDNLNMAEYRMAIQLKDYLPEAMKLADSIDKYGNLSKEDIEIAIRRGQERVKREEEARRNSRC